MPRRRRGGGTGAGGAQGPPGIPGTNGVGLLFGNGSPEGVVTAPVGYIYMQQDASSTLQNPQWNKRQQIGPNPTNVGWWGEGGTVPASEMATGERVQVGRQTTFPLTDQGIVFGGANIIGVGNGGGVIIGRGNDLTLGGARIILGEGNTINDPQGGAMVIGSLNTTDHAQSAIISQITGSRTRKRAGMVIGVAPVGVPNINDGLGPEILLAGPLSMLAEEHPGGAIPSNRGRVEVVTGNVTLPTIATVDAIGKNCEYEYYILVNISLVTARTITPGGTDFIDKSGVTTFNLAAKTSVILYALPTAVSGLAQNMWVVMSSYTAP